MSDADAGGAAPPDSGEQQSGQLPAPEAAAAPAGLREDLIANAVAFLSHPKVRASAAASKREFLQRKGLSEAEIDEAFRRVPQEAAGAAPPQPTAAAAPAAPAAVQATLQHLQPGPPYATASPQQQMQAYGQPQQAPPPPQQGVRWTQAVLGAGFLAATGYAAKQLVWPHLEGAYHSWRGRPRPPPRPRSAGGGASEEAARAMADAIQAQTAELRASIDAIRGLVSSLEAQQRERGEAGAAGAAGAPDGGLTVAELRRELRSFADTLHELASPAKPDGGGGGGGGSQRLEAELGEIKGLLAEILRSPSGSRTPGKEAGGDAATPLSVTSALARHGLNGAGPQAAGSSGSGGVAAAQQQPQQNGEPAEPAAAAGGAGLPAGGATGIAGGAAGAPAQPPHPASYMEVLEMLERGQTPPGIRTDINDKPPNPLAPPAEPKLKPRPKPWERSSTAQSGSGSSLASLGLLPPPPADGGSGGGTPAPGGASPLAAPAPTAEGSADLAARGLSPVRAPSPAEEAAQADGQPAGEGQAAPPASAFQSPKRAASIFEAVAPAPESPHIIAGRLSPSSSGRVPPGGGPASTGGSAAFASLLAAAEQRASAEGGPVLPLEGSGIGRPSSRNWRPPPIPAPTLSGGSSSRGGDAAAAGAAAAEGPEAGSGSGGSAAAPHANGGAGVQHSPSAASLGADFASA